MGDTDPQLASGQDTVQPETFVTVPGGPPNGVSLNGCFRSDGGLYGPNTLIFCLRITGIYRVTGAVRCNGALTWLARGRNVTVNLRQGRCSRGGPWQGATMTCTPVGPPREEAGRPRIGALNCSYVPNLGARRNLQFNARRISN